MPDRALFIAAARECVGTPFQHQGRHRGIGLDCSGLLLYVAKKLSLKDTSGKPFELDDYPDYSAQPLDEQLHHECEKRLITRTDEIIPGDVVTLRFPPDRKVPDLKQFPITHGGIVSSVQGELGLIHGYSGGNQKLVEHRMDAAWLRRIAGVFYFPGLED
jgi:cell wall-associated NlpC family hydrolase